MKLLLVDDDIFLRDMYEQKFMSSKHEVKSAKNAEEAQVMLDGESFDVLITDLVIPGGSGIDLLRGLQTSKDKAMVKIVLSNQSEDSSKEEAEKAGADGYLVKADLTPSEVVEAVEDIYKQNKQ